MKSQKDDELHRQRMEAAKALMREFNATTSQSKHNKNKKGRAVPVSAPASRASSENRYNSTRNPPSVVASQSRPVVGPPSPSPAVVRLPRADAYVDAVLAAERMRTEKRKNTQSPRLGSDHSHRGSCSENTPPEPSIRGPASSTSSVSGHRGDLGSSEQSKPATATINLPSIEGPKAVKYTQEDDLIDLNWPTADGQSSQARPEPMKPSSLLDFPVEPDTELGKLSHELSKLNISQSGQGVIVEPPKEAHQGDTQPSAPKRSECHFQECVERTSRGGAKRATRAISQEAVQSQLTYLMEGRNLDRKAWVSRDFLDDVSAHQLKSLGPTTVPLADISNEKEMAHEVNDDSGKRHQTALDIASNGFPKEAKGPKIAVEEPRCGCEKDVNLSLSLNHTDSSSIDDRNSDLTKSLLARANDAAPTGRQVQQLAVLVLIQSHKETCPIRRLLAEYYPLSFGESPATGQDADCERDIRPPPTTEGRENHKPRKGLADSKYA
ncbi:hypothetical protein ACRALDRAFT_1072642 [Sodiomyces alcalophilus JCM 7366]|uniref:uncharacterized protein n=1 Tax=Sodiomyces alcalophilus JCM 7366 TaxID=591952 RepID=UPI0039B55AB5